MNKMLMYVGGRLVEVLLLMINVVMRECALAVRLEEKSKVSPPQRW